MKKVLLLLVTFLAELTAQALPIDAGPDTAASTPQYTYNSATGALTLNWGEFNQYNNWSGDIINTSVKSVTATSEVSFTGDCSQLFYNFNHCESMDLSRVNTSEMTNANRMFRDCSSLTSLDLSSWNVANVTDMFEMFCYCESLTSLNLSGWNTANVIDMGLMFYYLGFQHRQCFQYDPNVLWLPKPNFSQSLGMGHKHGNDYGSHVLWLLEPNLTRPLKLEHSQCHQHGQYV